MKLSAAWKHLFLVFFVICGILSAFNRIFPFRFEWQGESPYFENSLDVNRDGEITRAEWEVLERGTSIHEYGSAQRQFDRIDCNQNGRLTWSEYFQNVFAGMKCPTTGLLENIANNEPLYQSNAPLPILYTGDQVEALKRDDSITAFLTVAKSYPSDIYEEEIQQKNRITIECSSSQTNLSNRIPDLEVSSALSCNIDNRIQDTAISLVILSVSQTNEIGEYITIHARPVYIQPRSSGTLLVLFPEVVNNVDVQLYGLRGMPTELLLR